MSDNSLFLLFPERLRKLRLEENISQKDMSKKLYVTASMISKYETGKSNPSLTLIETIVKEYGVSVDWLLGLSDEMHGNNISINKYSDILEIVFRMEDIPKIELKPAECENGEVCLAFNNRMILEMLKRWEGLRDAELSSDAYETAKADLIKRFDIRLNDLRKNQPTQEELVLMEIFGEPNRYKKPRVTKNKMRVK